MGAPDRATLAIRLLGGFQVAVGAQPVPDETWRRRRAADLIKLLALAPGHELARDEVLEALWPDLVPAAAANNLRVTVHALRAALHIAAPSGPDPLRLRGDRLALWPSAPVATDVAAFEAAAATAQRGDDPAACDVALALYAGDLLPEDRYAEWVAARREALRDAWLRLLEHLAGLRERNGDLPAAIAALERLVVADPAREEAHVALMRLYERAGQRALALRQWARMEAALRAELGVQPAATSRALYHDLLAASEASAIPAAREAAVARVADTLPLPLTSFVGRGREIAAVRDQLAVARLVTLTGPGGVGKTRLGLEVGRASREAFVDGICFVELATLRDPALVANLVAGSLAVREEPGCPIADSLVESLRARALLLILDNCEHLAEAVADLVAFLLAAAPALRVLATSRAPLGVPGEVVWRVPPLGLPVDDAPTGQHAAESVALFTDRLRWRQPGFIPSPGDAAAVAAICRRLDGLPLALELAAARAGVLSLAEIAARLDDAPGLLTSGARVAPERQRSLRAALDWSYDLLTEDEQRLFRGLAVFAGGWQLDAAEVVGCGAGVPREAILDLLAALLDKSLVQPDDGGATARYRLLEPVRQYAAERLIASGERETVQSRHAGYFLALVETAAPALDGPAQARWMARLAAEHDNLRAALGWALARGDGTLALRLAVASQHFWYNQGHGREGLHWLEAALARADAAPVALRARALEGAGSLARMTGDFAVARECYEASLALGRVAEIPEAVARALNSLAYLAHQRGDDPDAIALATESLAIYRRLGDPRGVPDALHTLAVARERQGLLDEAHAAFAEYLALERAAGNHWGIAHGLNAIGEIAAARGDLATARGCFAEALSLARSLDNRHRIAHALLNLGGLAHRQGDLATARGQMDEALRIFRALGEITIVARCLRHVARVAQAEGDLPAFRAATREGLALAHNLPDWALVADFLETLASAVANEAGLAARFWGAAESLRAAHGLASNGSEGASPGRALVAARGHTGAASWEAALAAGRALSPDAAVAEALAVATSDRFAGGRHHAPLSPRERQIAALIAAGSTNAQIAAALGVAPRTVDTHVRNILKKLGAASRAEVAARLSGDAAPQPAVVDLT
jgi:predicted ATPase/DNA-binding SARP family transcriptional activator/DNA-binding CsgD family transcriptional regulator